MSGLLIEKRCKKDGQGMAEYALIGALVLIGGMAGLALLGQGLQGQMGSMVPPPAKTVAAAHMPGSGQQVLPPVEIPSMVGNNAGSNGTTLKSPDTMQIKLSDGTTLTLRVPNDASKTIMTIGANGTTTLLAQSLESLASQLKSQGKIDEEGSNAILKLANLSHRIARMEEVVEAVMAQSNGNLHTALNTPVQFEGKTYASVTELTELLRTGEKNPDGSFNFGAQTDEFFDAFSALWPAGVMQDPQVEAIIDVYAHEIANLADGNRAVINQMSNSYGTTDQYHSQLARYMTTIGYNDTASKLSEKAGSAVTHVDSAQICTTGGNNDAGTNCSL